MRSNLIDLTVHRHAQTAKAVRVSDDGEDSKAVWLPLSQIEIGDEDGNHIEITLPEWLAKDKGLI